MPLSGEVCAHHIALTDESIRVYDTNFKMNPPLRSPEDAAACWTALAEGTAVAIATDHAPHTEVDKHVEFGWAINGISGIETPPT